MKKDVFFIWDQVCHNAFKNIKKYLLSPPILHAPVPDRPLILYTAAQERSLGVLLAQDNDQKRNVHFITLVEL